MLARSERLIANWVYGGFLAGVLLLVLTPVVTRAWPHALVAVFLLLPVYMVHQYEEHDDDRFRAFINRSYGGKPVLSALAVFVINVPGVWGVIALSFVLASTVNIGFGLIAVYLVLVNGVVHIIPAAIFRSYNPGLGTAIVLFLPAGWYAFREIQASGGATLTLHAIGLLSAIAIHVVIVAWVTANARAMR